MTTKPFTLWTRRVLSNVETLIVRHLDFNRDIRLGGTFIAMFGTDHNCLQFAGVPYTIQ